MATERKTKMISLRLPDALVARVDFVVRNSGVDEVKNRSVALQTALELWLPGHEQRLEKLGLTPPKKVRTQA